MARRHVSLIVRTETRRRIRAMVDDPKRLIPVVLAVAFGSMFVLAVAFGGFVAGEAATTEPFERVAGAAGAVAGFLAGFAAFIVGLRVLQTGGLSAGDDLLLTAARHRDVVYSQVIVEALVPFAMLSIPGVIGAVAFGLGSSSPVAPVLLAAAGIGAVAVGVTAGFTIGLGIKLLVSRWAVLAKYKFLVATLLGLGYFVALTTDAFGAVVERAVGVLATTPLRWVGDLVLLGTVPAASPLRAGGAAVMLVLTGAGLLAASSRLAARLWYETPVQPESEAHASSMRGLPGLGRPTSRIVRKTWLRARRSPIRLVYVVYPVFLFVGPAATVVREGAVPPATVPALVLYGAWTAGAAFTLNPIGDETPVLPVTLTTAVTGRTFVGAVCLASAVVAVPATLVVALAVGVVGGFPPPDLLFVGLVAVALPALAPALASGVGAAFPRTTQATVSRGRQAVVPSIPAFVGFSVLLSVLTVPLWLATPGTGRSLVAGAVGVTPAVAGAAGTAATILLVGVASAGSFLFAAHRFDEYTVA